MRRIPGQIRLAFLPVFAIILAIVFFLFQATLDFRSLSAQYVILNTVFAILISLGAALLSLAGFVLLGGFFGKRWRRLLVRITLYTVARAVGGHSRTVEALGIGEQSGSVVIRLAVGSNESIVVGDKFEAVNTATGDKLGVVEVIEVEGDSCLCSVFDRMNLEFWDELELRMRRDPSPTAGVTFLREVPGEFLASVRKVLQRWGG